MTTVQVLKRELREIKRLTHATGPDVIIVMWCPDRGDGKSGYARFNMKTPNEKTPVTEEEEKKHV